MANKPKRLPAPAPSKPLFDWFDHDKANRGKMRAVGYSDGQITNWKDRGIPRAQLDQVVGVMGISSEQYLASAGQAPLAARQARADYRALSDEALEIARAFDLMQPQTKERVREHVFIYSVIDRSFPWLRSGKPVSGSYDQFEKWHEDNMKADLALEAARIEKLKK